MSWKTSRDAGARQEDAKDVDRTPQEIIKQCEIDYISIEMAKQFVGEN